MVQELKLSQVLTQEDLRELQQASDLRGFFSLFINWLFVAAAFAVFILWPNPLSFIFGSILLGGRQLGIGILVHDCAHNTMFKTLRVNNFVGHYLCGMPLNVSLYDYRRTHMQHHRYAGTEQDPDRIYIKNYPVESDSLKRKLLRDLTGRTGFRDTIYKFKRLDLSKHYPWLIFHGLLLTCLTLLGNPLAYLIWWSAELFVYPIVVRMRQIGEHGVAIDRDNPDPRANTSTTLAAWWEKLLIAPNDVHYHLEHHIYANVPSYNLSKLHKLLLDSGYYQDFNCINKGYRQVLKRAVRT